MQLCKMQNDTLLYPSLVHIKHTHASGVLHIEKCLVPLLLHQVQHLMWFFFVKQQVCSKSVWYLYLEVLVIAAKLESQCAMGKKPHTSKRYLSELMLSVGRPCSKLLNNLSSPQKSLAYEGTTFSFQPEQMSSFSSRAQRKMYFHQVFPFLPRMLLILARKTETGLGQKECGRGSCFGVKGDFLYFVPVRSCTQAKPREQMMCIYKCCCLPPEKTGLSYSVCRHSSLFL